MSKQEVTDRLRGLGFDAELVEGVVIIWTDKPLHKGQKTRIRNELRSMGYRGSWGWKVKKEEVA